MIDVKIAVKNTFKALVIVKADICGFLIVFGPKVLHKPGLANLSHPIHYQGFTVKAVFPLCQFFYDVPLHLRKIVVEFHIKVKIYVVNDHINSGKMVIILHINSGKTVINLHINSGKMVINLHIIPIVRVTHGRLKVAYMCRII